MDNELKEIRKEISSYEEKLLELITKRISLGEKVAEIKFKYLEKKNINMNDKEILHESITNKAVENKIYNRLSENIEDEKLKNIIIDLYKNYIIPKTKEIQINTLIKLNKS